MAQLYERFLKVLQKWPLNADYPPPLRSLPAHLRDQGKAAFSARGEFSGDTLQCEKRLSSLERLTTNQIARAYPRTQQTGALGLTSDQCVFALSDSYQKSLETSATTSLFQRIVSSFRQGSGKEKA
ncbi:ubiquinol-cytochrome-c reductase complex assembly factor 2 [Thrips palmi]|uniref:Ubiquinol-cytochrome-c reductase complex assembly factor 2 n=1 Tax=Thrips palmi TaxID=161013 RepID=A0A6P8Y956_THRPL|nr:ubiquinol-cytochrome-c reductase complex assembly factor 2 [Thrips palmi]XP_034232672.1 ubiquinol-cytochrome-c reductase complex assembly factor 2 [Thrips palmi]XP_034232673.1 ubiquinol-cytochrome-c reductase complex assembly factor 2 [Thrips palmi]